MKISANHSRILPALLLAAMFGSACSDKESTPADTRTIDTAPANISPETEAVTETQTEIMPAEGTEAITEDASATGQTAAAPDGQKIYQTTCVACHATGAAGAPKLGDKDAWAPRIAKGTDTLFSSVLNGLNAMPPKGTCMSCSDDELRAAMEYIISEGS